MKIAFLQVFWGNRQRIKEYLYEILTWLILDRSFNREIHSVKAICWIVVLLSSSAYLSICYHDAVAASEEHKMVCKLNGVVSFDSGWVSRYSASHKNPSIVFLGTGGTYHQRPGEQCKHFVRENVNAATE